MKTLKLGQRFLYRYKALLNAVGRMWQRLLLAACYLINWTANIVARGGQLGCFKLPQCKPRVTGCFNFYVSLCGDVTADSCCYGLSHSEQKKETSEKSVVQEHF
jgi:hypothetical protein